MDFTVKFKGTEKMVYDNITEIRITSKLWTLYRDEKPVVVLENNGELDTIDCHLESPKQIITSWEEEGAEL